MKARDMVFVLGLTLAAPVARAETPVVVDRESLQLQLRDLEARLGRLKAAQAASGAGKLVAELGGFEVQIQILAQLLDSAPVAGAILLRFPPPAPRPGGSSPPAPAAPRPVATPPPPAAPAASAPATAAASPAAPAVEGAAAKPAGVPIDDQVLGAAIQRINDEGFEQEKLKLVRELAAANYFRVAQVERMMPYFSFERTRVKAVELLAPRIVDRENLGRLTETFQVPGNKKKVQKVLGR